MSATSWKGPRRIVSARLTLETVLVLEAAAKVTTQSRSALVTRILEDWTANWLSQHGQEIRAERAAREARKVDDGS